MIDLLLANIWTPSADELRLLGPELAIVATIVAALVVPMCTRRDSRLVAVVVLLGVVVAALLTRQMGERVALGSSAGLTPPGKPPLMIWDNLAVVFKMLVLATLALVIGLWFAGQAARRRTGDGAIVAAPAGPEFFVLLLTSALGMMLMVSSLDLLIILIAIETASIPSYALVASDRRSRLGAEAALKYVLFGAASAAIMIYGISLLYGVFGTFSVSAIARQMAAATDIAAVAWVGLALTGAGIAFKIAAVPFHFWCPDVFEGAPVEITTWLSVASKAAGLALLLRIVHAFIEAAPSVDVGSPLTFGGLAWGIGIIASITCTVGNLAALRQTSVKRILAYSSIAHAGYMMMVAAIVVRPDSYDGASSTLAALLAYLFVYLLMNVGAFGVTAMVVWRTGRDDLGAFSGLGRRAPWLALPMALCLFSLVGLPPLGGFAAKWWLLVALGEAAAKQTWLWGLVLVAVANTVVSLYYYVGIIRAMYLADDEATVTMTSPKGGLLLVNGCAVMLLLLGTVWFNALGQRARAYATDIFHVGPARVWVSSSPSEPPLLSQSAAHSSQTPPTSETAIGCVTPQARSFSRTEATCCCSSAFLTGESTNKLAWSLESTNKLARSLRRWGGRLKRHTPTTIGVQSP